MATVSYSSFDVFNSMVNGEQSRENISFLERKLGEGLEYLTDAGRRTMQRARDFFEGYDFEGVSRSVRAIKRKVEDRWRGDDIRPLGTMAQLQNAGLTMQRWLMANPNLRGTWQKGRCDGYSDTYVDMEPGAIGANHTDYCKVMNGMMQTNEEGHCYSVTYFDAIVDGREELQLDQKIDIQHGWDWSDYYLALGGDDPSSQSNGSL